jgi:hypothetical protein
MHKVKPKNRFSFSCPDIDLQRIWLTKEFEGLKEGNTKPKHIIVFMHHPLFLTGWPSTIHLVTKK